MEDRKHTTPFKRKAGYDISDVKSFEYHFFTSEMFRQPDRCLKLADVSYGTYVVQYVLDWPAP